MKIRRSFPTVMTHWAITAGLGILAAVGTVLPSPATAESPTLADLGRGLEGIRIVTYQPEKAIVRWVPARISLHPPGQPEKTPEIVAVGGKQLISGEFSIDAPADEQAELLRRVREAFGATGDCRAAVIQDWSAALELGGKRVLDRQGQSGTPTGQPVQAMMAPGGAALKASATVDLRWEEIELRHEQVTRTDASHDQATLSVDVGTESIDVGWSHDRRHEKNDQRSLKKNRTIQSTVIQRNWDIRR